MDARPADPRKAKTLGEAAENADGTFNGARALSWLSEVLNPGRGASPEEVQKVFDRMHGKKAKP